MSQTIPKAMAEKFAAITALTDAFCAKYPSPLTKPDPQVLIKADPASARQLAGKGVKGTVE